MKRQLINTKKIQSGTRKLALLLSDSTFISIRKIRQATRTVFGSDEAKHRLEFLGQLESLLKSDSPTVRLAVVEALGRVSRGQAQTAEGIQSILQGALTDGDPEVRRAAATALAQN